MQTKVRFILTFACLLATSCGSPKDTSLPTVTATETPTLIPTITKTYTPTNTPKPTETFTPTPTETPGPYWQTPFGEFPHAVNDTGQEMFNFEAPFDQWLVMPNLAPSTIKAYHDALKKIKLSDGTPLIKPMNGPEYQNLPPLNWGIHYVDYFHYGDALWIGNDNIGDPLNNPRTKYVGGAFFDFKGNETNRFSALFLVVTMQVEDLSQPDGYSLWTVFDHDDHYTGMESGKIPALFNNRSQLAPYVTFDPQASDSQYIDLVRFLQAESEFDEKLYEQALRDFVAGRPNDYLYSHFLLTQIGATRWHPPQNP